MPGEELHHAIALIKSGQKEPARSILTRLIQADPHNAVAWLWLAETMSEGDGRIAVLEACLKQNPQSQVAQRGLERLRERQAPTPEPSIGGAPTSHAPAAIETQTIEPKESFAGLTTEHQNKRAVARKPNARQRRQSRTRWLILVLLGFMALGAVGTTGYFMQDQLRGWLGLTGTTAIPSLDGSAQLTPGGDKLPQTALTQSASSVPAPTLTPTPTITPVPTPTATVAFVFSYPIIAPENGTQVVQVGGLASIPAQCVAISSDNRLLAAGLDDSTVIVWNLSAGNSTQIYQGHNKAVNAVDFSPDNRYLVSGSEDGTVRIWDVNAAVEVKTLVGHNNAVKSVAFSPDGYTFASGSLDGSIDLWQLDADTAIRILPAGGAIISLDFSPDGRLLAAGLQTGVIQVWDVAAGSLLKTLKGHGGAVNSVEFAPSGHRLATGSSDKSVKLWDVDGGKVLYTIGSHTDIVLSVSFSPDGRVLASASLGQTIKLWDVAERRELIRLRHARNIPAITFSADGRVLAAALSPTNPTSREGGVALWGVLQNPASFTEKIEPTITPETEITPTPTHEN